MLINSRNLSSLLITISLIIIFLGSSYSIFALPPPPPPAPVIPGFTYNDTNGTAVNTTNVTINTTTNTTENDTIDTAADTDTTITGTDPTDDTTETNPTTDTTLTTSTTGATNVISEDDESVIITIYNSTNNPDPIPNSSANHVSNNTQPAESGQSNNGDETSSTTSNYVDYSASAGSEDPAKTLPLTDSPSTITSFADAKDLILAKVGSTLGMVSAVVVLVLLILFVVLNRNSNTPNKKSNMLVRPSTSLPKYIQQMPLNYMPPRVGPQSQHLQTLQLKYRDQLLQKRKFMKYQRYLSRIHQMHLLNSQRQQEVPNQQVSQAQQGINPNYQQQVGQQSGNSTFEQKP